MSIVVAPILIPVFGFLLCLVLWALSQSGQSAIRAILDPVVGWIRSIPVVGSSIAGAIDSVIHTIVDAIARAALAIEAPVAAWFWHVASVAGSLVRSVFNPAA